LFHRLAQYETCRRCDEIAFSDRRKAGEKGDWYVACPSNTEGSAMKKFILSAMLAFVLATGAMVATSIASQPAYAGCGCQP
jgi:hypothetical protein